MSANYSRGRFEPLDLETHKAHSDAPKRFWGFLRKYKRLVVVGAMGNIFSVSIVMLTPIFLKLIIDEAIPSKNIGLLLGLVAGFVVLQTLRHLVAYAHEYVTHYVGQRTVFDIRRALFHHLQLLHLAFYERHPSASLVSRVIYDATAIQSFIHTAFSSLANGIVSLLIALTIMFFLNWQLTLFCLIALPIYFMVIHAFRKRLRAQHHEVKERQSRLAGMLGETFSGIRVVKSFAQEDHERKRFVLRIKDNFYTELQLPIIGQRMHVSLGMLFTVFYAIVMLWAGISVVRGGMTIGSFVAYTSYLMMLFAPLQNLSQLIQSSTNARTGFERILTLLETKPRVKEDDNAIVPKDVKGHVVFDKVDFSYEKDRKAIDAFNLDVAPGEIIALVGPSGSGKSTLMSLLTRFYDVDAGRILIDGVDVRRLKYDVYRQNLGIVLQENFLFTGSVEENIRYGRPDATMDEVKRAAKLANALEFIREMPGKFGAYVGQGGTTLSGGQRQRIAIARCILKNPKILIFDEATSALDTESESLIQASLDTLMKGRTVFIVAHRLTTIRRAHRIVVMERGRIAEIGTHAELLAADGIYRRLYQPKLHRKSGEGAAQPAGEKSALRA